MRTVDIFLRTHSGVDVHSGGRVLDIQKEDLIFGCLRSLVRSLSVVDTAKYYVRMTILDDHSNSLCLQGMEEICSAAPFPVAIIPLFSRGVGPSFGATYLYARDHAEDLIYFVEDDYLHTESALQEMFAAEEYFSRILGDREVAIFPVDYPDNYDALRMNPSFLVHGPRRHWRTVDATTGTFLISRKAFLTGFVDCMKMSLYAIDPSVNEDTSINHLWRQKDIILFSPIPSLAIHMQGKDQMPPFIDWKGWWEQYSK